MLRPTLASTYALQAVICLASFQKEQGNVPLASHRIAREWHIPERFLLKVLKPLVAAGVLESLKGPSGGYRLARPPREITLRDIIEAVDGPLQSSPPAAADLSPHLQEWLGQIWSQLAEHIRAHLSQFCIEDYLSRYPVEVAPPPAAPAPETAPAATAAAPVTPPAAPEAAPAQTTGAPAETKQPSPSLQESVGQPALSPSETPLPPENAPLAGSAPPPHPTEEHATPSPAPPAPPAAPAAPTESTASAAPAAGSVPPHTENPPGP
jgi:Rrf2 family protein